MNKELKINNNIFKSKIIFKKNYIEKYLNNLSKKNNKIFCIVDINVKYALKNILKKNNLKIIYLNCGEHIKNITTYNKIIEKLLDYKIDRDSIIVAIGGGTLGDLTGFIASSVLRGVNYKLIPTTLLSQVDSSIGGKNGINSSSGKNLIGSFYQPDEILIDVGILNSLPKREIKSGYSEIVKHAIIKDSNFFVWLEKNYSKIFKLEKNILEKAIFKSILIKSSFVKKDYKEKLKNEKSRAMLNFGHSIGHALENLYKYRNIKHGEAISIGMVVEAIISEKLGFIKSEKVETLINHFKKSGLKITDKKLKDPNIFRILQNDKKNSNNQINLVLLYDIGKPFYCRDIDIKILKKILRNI